MKSTFSELTIEEQQTFGDGCTYLQAKKRAQYDPGVGNLTDVVLINDKYARLEETAVSAIDTCYVASATVISGERDKCAEEIRKAIYGA